MLHSGSCKCGAVKFEIDQDPLWSGYCHCRDCRKATGAPVSAFVIFTEAGVRWSGEPKEHRPSDEVRRTFCGFCGTPISYQYSQWPVRIDFYTALFEDV